MSFTLLGTGVRPVPSVAAPPGFDTRPSQQRMQRHVGRQAAEVAWWWSLHEGLHVAMQVPAQLVGSVAACEWWWRFGWLGPGSGPAGALGDGLAGWPGKGLAAARRHPRQGPCREDSWAPSVRTLPRIFAFLSSFDLDYSLSSQRSACHHGGASRALSQCVCLALVGSKVARSAGVGELPRQGS